MARIYVTTNPAAPFKYIANTSTPRPLIGLEGTYYPTSKDMLLVSHDGVQFSTVLFGSTRSGGDDFEGTVSHPALGIGKTPIRFVDGVMTCGGAEYVLDEAATVTTVVTTPIMHVFTIVNTYAGYYVSAKDQLNDKTYSYLGSDSLKVVDGRRVRGGDVVEDVRFIGHRYLVVGDHMDTERQTATFDGLPATILTPEDYVVVFADDLSAVVSVTKK